MKRLENQVAVITGGARGIGYGIAEKYISEGAKVIVADILDDGPERVARLGENAAFYHINLRNREEIFTMADKLAEEYGHLDVLVNCAGIALPVPTFKLTEEDLDKVIEINMKAPLYCCQAIGMYMRRQGKGSIVNISSGNSRMINVGRTPYGITKGAVNLLTMQLGAEWSMYGIKVNAIAPGWIETEMVKRPLRLGILDARKIMSVSPIGRFGQVEEIANLATFLACEESNYIVGQVIFADGGWNLGIMPDGLDFVRENDKLEE